MEELETKVARKSIQRKVLVRLKKRSKIHRSQKKPNFMAQENMWLVFEGQISWFEVILPFEARRVVFSIECICLLRVLFCILDSLNRLISY
jgi:hypothetical protein